MAPLSAPAPVRVRSVWDDNLEDEFKLIRDVAELYQFCAMDTEFPGVVARPVGVFRHAHEFKYQTLKMNVDMLKLIQLGLTFTDAEGNLPVILGEPCVWQFNFRGFRVRDDVHARDSIDLLTNSGVDLERQEQRGVDVFRFGELLMTSGVVLNDDLTFITFHSGYDFGYLLKALTGCTPLPPSEDQFLALLRVYFPRFLDVKVMIEQLQGLTGLHGLGLQRVSEHLQVPRIGQEHQAGSDSLLTLQVFMRLAAEHFQGIEGTLRFNGMLYGFSPSSAAADGGVGVGGVGGGLSPRGWQVGARVLGQDSGAAA